MTDDQRFVASTVVIGAVTLTHGVITWPMTATLAFFGGGALIAFLAEAVGINLGLLEHHLGPKFVEVPLYVLFGWTATVYVAFRIGLLVTGGWTAVLIAGVLATMYDVFTDYRSLEDGHWTYTDEIPGPRYRGVPWWNFVAWFGISCTTAALAVPFL